MFVLNGLTPSSSPEPPRFDPTGLLALFGADRVFLEEFVALFRDDSTRLERELQAAIESRDVDQLLHAAHSLKGMLAHLGPTVAARLNDDLESLTTLTDQEHPRKILAALSRELALIYRDLERL